MTATIMCPSCGTATELDRLSRTADEFCKKCDYPLFWAPVPTTLATLGGEETAETTLRRLPGAGGRRAVASVPCPTCAELNAPTSLVCHRCNGPMVLVEPEPEPEPEPELEPMPAPEPITIPDERSNAWWWVALAVGLVLVTVLVVLLVAV
ncbi:MAG: hypothetical protein JWO68_2586 [Actinomycetia bacterium]|nr:hypothetical protein [Actinomycetes bacterium]